MSLWEALLLNMFDIWLTRRTAFMESMPTKAQEKSQSRDGS
jgi:hypothetical protein